MANDVSKLKPTELIASRAIPVMLAKSGFLGKVDVENRQSVQVDGGDTIRITKESALMTPTNVDYATGGTLTNITIPYVDLTFGFHKELKFKATELEQRISSGGWASIKKHIDRPIFGSIAKAVDSLVGALYASAATQVGAANTPLTDPVLRAGLVALEDFNVDPDDGDLFLTLSPKGFTTDLLGINQYVQVINTGVGGAITAGKIPTLFNMNVNWTNNFSTASGTPTTRHGLMFHRSAIAIGFMEFEPVNSNSNLQVVEEELVKDEESGIFLRVMKFFDANLRTWFYQVDCKCGVVVQDANRMVDVLH